MGTMYIYILCIYAHIILHVYTYIFIYNAGASECRLVFTIYRPGAAWRHFRRRRLVRRWKVYRSGRFIFDCFRSGAVVIDLCVHKLPNAPACILLGGITG